jgi:uncharacterized BrkB/YihY/UPF0761 family membrane protein
VLLRAVPRPPPGFKAGDPIPPELIRGAMISLLALLGGFVAFVLGIIAIVVGRGALRRMHYEPGNWKGARRAHVGWIIGALTIVGPIALLVARLVLARLFPRGA